MLRHAVVAILMFCLLTSIGRAQFNTGPPPPQTAADKVDDQPFAQWVKHGKMLWEQTYFTSGRLSVWIYKNPSGKAILLHNSISGINELFRYEINTKDDVAAFMHEELSEFLLIMLGLDNWNILNQNSGKVIGNSNIQSKLNIYEITPSFLIAGNSWTLTMNVMTKMGGIENWHVTGSVKPFQIVSFARKIEEPDGTFGETEVTD